MNNSKKEILNNIRRAIIDVPETEQPDDIEIERTYRREGFLYENKIVELFKKRVGEYQATIRQVEQTEIVNAIDESCQRENIKNLVIPEGFRADFLPASVKPLFDLSENPLSNRDLDESDGVVTTCAYAVAQTGTIILDAGKGQGRRALTLIPDYHLCLVHQDQILHLISEGFTALEESIKVERRPVTFISGPSATSDIELSRVEGVHGPRRLDVIIYR
jgi:L-lactate dehydrogenase complex protein LldG